MTGSTIYRVAGRVSAESADETANLEQLGAKGARDGELAGGIARLGLGFVGGKMESAGGIVRFNLGEPGQ